ncbi:Predicted dienelactone hydrolase [Palleronia salina]|uniref:Predicted dienelactone hydrolase n=2 Tax=Palleronia salina TaxID=313368 RepID=A0A1M6EAJ9_9RHOB|nr:Predicted dienelactone hydrolase [Palleronia salina]
MLKKMTFAAAIAALPAWADHPIDVVRPDAPTLAPFGDRVIGVRTMTFTREGVVDVLNATEDAQPTYDRDLTVEIWYPAAEGTEPGGTYEATLRDGETTTTLTGRAARDAAPASGETFPLVLISHGYPGNRFLMSHLGENLASKGYVTASIDHTDSTYSDMAAFGSTLYNRPQDQAFVLDQMAGLEGDLGAIIDGDTAGLIGYSMGGYGALIFAGAGLDAAPLDLAYAPPGGLLEELQVGADLHESLSDERLKAVIAIGPWGRNRDFWSAEGLSQIDLPLMIMAGSVDDVSVYDDMRTIFDETTGTRRHLLTFEDANHNAAAPMPAPPEAMDPELDIFSHYGDAVWDNRRMNNIAQHFATAFMDLHLKGDSAKADYLDLVENASDGVWSVDDDGTEQDDHTYWEGFPERTAVGLRFETREAE